MQVVAVFDDLGASDELRSALDERFGPKGWIEADYRTAGDFLRANTRTNGACNLAVIGLGGEDDTAMARAEGFLKTVPAGSWRSILAASNSVSSSSVHRLLRAGAGDFVPLPLPPESLDEAVTRLIVLKPETVIEAGGSAPRGKVIAVYRAAGGMGATTIATNLAWELASIKKDPVSVGLIDLDLQFGDIATYLDLPKRDSAYELMSNAGAIDATSLEQTMAKFKDSLRVLTCPPDVVPLDMISGNDVELLLNVAAAQFDFTIVDLPAALTEWSEQVFAQSEITYVVTDQSVRGAKDTLRYLQGLKAAGMDMAKVQLVLNRSPGMFDLAGRSRVKAMEKSFGVDFSHWLSEGGPQVVEAEDQGVPLAISYKRNALRNDLKKLAVKLQAEASAQVNAQARH